MEKLLGLISAPLLLLIIFYTSTLSPCKASNTQTLASLLDQTISAVESLATGARTLSTASIDSTTSSTFLQNTAWSDCLDFFDHNIELLTASKASTNPDDTQTWLSAALTNHETCIETFNELNLPLPAHFLPQALVANISSMVSSALAINKPSTSPFAKRKLLSDGFPSWLSAGDRRLLQTKDAIANADAVVAKDGSGQYTSISAAVAAAKNRGSTGRYIIYVKGGVYDENVVVTRKMNNIMVVGDGAGSTVVTGNLRAGQTTTFRSATFAVMGPGFIAKDITFENTAGPGGHQAVAFRSGSDHSVLYGCTIRGYQDTLYVYAMRQFYRECSVYGTVDFIFGNAAAVLQSCGIFIRKPMGGQMNTVTAQNRKDPNQNTGIIIHGSTITAASDLRPVQGGVKSYLGRPWQAYSRVVVMKSSIDSVIAPAGWLAWNGGTNSLYYAEYMNTGGGAGTGGRVRWGGYHVLTSAIEASKFTVGNFLSGNSWIPSSGVPFDAGL